MIAKLSQGARDFRARRFFEAHESWEEAWLGLPRGAPARERLQALIQLAGALHLAHGIPRPRPGAARRLARRVLDRFGATSPSCLPIRAPGWTPYLRARLLEEPDAAWPPPPPRLIRALSVRSRAAAWPG